MRATSVRHKFVDVVPGQLERETLYVSIPFATAAHLCLCGCGHEVVTPLSPTDWRLIFDGATVSLEPSIGNWSYPCQSHYWTGAAGCVGPLSGRRRRSSANVSETRGPSSVTTTSQFQALT